MDIEQIDNFLSNDSKQEIQYSDAQWLYLNDSNNNSYNNVINIKTTQLKQQFVDYHNAVLFVPMTIEVPVSAQPELATRPPLIAMRNSVLDLIGLQVISTDQGQTIVNERDTHHINNLRLSVEHNMDWVYSNGSEFDFGVDRTVKQVCPSGNAALLPSGGGTVKDTQYSTYSFQGRGTQASANQPVTNDLAEFVGENYGALSLTSNGLSGGAQRFTNIGGVTGTPTLALASTIATGYAIGALKDGSEVSLSIQIINQSGAASQTPTGFSCSPTTVDSVIGGVSLAAVTVRAAGVFPTVIQMTAQGSAYNADRNETVPAEIPIEITITAVGTAYLSAVGGVSALVTTTTATPHFVVRAATPRRNPSFNAGFLDRVTIFQNTSTYELATNVTPNMHRYRYTALLPLKYLHDFWMQMNFAIINVGWDLQFYLNQFNGSSRQANYPPFQTSGQLKSAFVSGGANVDLALGSYDDTQQPTITYGDNGNIKGCRLYYRVVKFSPNTTAEVAQKLTSGFTKSIKFISTDVYTPSGNIIDVNSSSTMLNLVQSVVHPLRLWVLPYPTNALKSNHYASQIMPGSFTNTNVLVNNLPYYRQAQQTHFEKWTMLKEQFSPDTGSILNFEDWRNYKRVLCFDLTRLSDRLASPTEPVSLTFQGQRDDGFPYQLELITLCERQNQVTFRFSSSDVAIVVGNLD